MLKDEMMFSFFIYLSGYLFLLYIHVIHVYFEMLLSEERL